MSRTTRSRASRRTGSAEPTRSVVPEFATSDWEDVHAVNAAGGLEMLEWQDGVMEGWTARTRDGLWAAPVCGCAVPRQNGKTLGVVEARMNYGAAILGERIIYTAHLQKTSTETFEDMAAFFDTPALRRHVKDVKTAIGRERIVMKNGGDVKFLARTRNGGRGQHGDLLVFDEASELDERAQASFLPVISASDNPQTIYASTPPTPEFDGSVLRKIRRSALTGATSATAWAEWSVDEIGDVSDRDRWYETNPSLGILIDERSVANELEQMDEDTFARERLGWWSVEQSRDTVIDAADWAECATDCPPSDGLTVYAVKFAPDGARGTLSVCVRPRAGRPYVEVVENRSLSGGLQWFVGWLVPRASGAAQVVVDGMPLSQTLTERLLVEGVRPEVILRPSSSDVAAACAGLEAAVAERAVAHYGQPALDASATGCTRRLIGHRGGWGFESTEDADSTLVESVALALWGATVTKRNPGKRLRVG